mgnify:CR=1 FL=1
MTRQFGMYTYRIRGKRGPFKIILPDSFCSFLTPPGMSGSPPSFSDYLYFYSFMDRNVHAHFYRQPISIDCQVLFIFFFSGRLCTDIVLFLIFRIGLIKSAVLSSGLSAGSPPLLRSALRTLSFFRDYKSGLPSVLPHLARSETAHTPGSSHRQYRRSLCKPPRTEYASLSLSHIFRIHLRTAWLSFSLGKGSAREIPFFL